MERKIREILNGLGPARALMVANKLGLFNRLAEKPQRAEQMARALRLNTKALERLLNALVALGFLRKKAKIFFLSDGMVDYLTYRGAYSMTRWIDLSDDLWEAWNQLEGLVKTGKPAFSILDLVHKNPRKLEDFVHAMHPRAVIGAKLLMDRVDLHGVRSMLDLGGGPGTYALEWAQHFPKLKGTIFDIPPVIRITREYIRRYHLQDRVEARACDVLRSSLGEGYDLILLANLLQMHTPADCRQLLRRVYRALAPGGRAIIHGYAKREEGTVPEEAALFSLQIGLVTPGGDAHPLADEVSWMRSAGFKNPEVIELEMVPPTLIVGHK